MQNELTPELTPELAPKRRQKCTTSGKHSREILARLFLAALALLNLWVSYVIRAAHPVLAAVNAVMAVVLLLALLVDVVPRAPGRMGEK